MSKHIIELRPDCKVVQQICEKDGQIYIGSKWVNYLEELTADYIKDHYKELFGEILTDEYNTGYKDGCNVTETQAQDDAYRRGFEDGNKSGYEKGLNAVGTYRKGYTIGYDDGYDDGKKSIDKGCEGCKYHENTSLTNPCSECTRGWVDHYKPVSDSDRIEVWDVIANNTEPELKVWVTALGEMGFCGMAITDFGSVNKGELYDSCSTKGWHKTGRHFDIQSILDAMKQ